VVIGILKSPDSGISVSAGPVLFLSCQCCRVIFFLQSSNYINTTYYTKTKRYTLLVPGSLIISNFKTHSNCGEFELRSSLNNLTFLALRLVRLSLSFFEGGRRNSLLSSSHCHPRYVTFNGGFPSTFLSTTLASLMSSMSSYLNGGAGSPPFFEQQLEFGSLQPSVQKMSPRLPNSRRHPNALQKVDFRTGPVNCL